MQVNRDRAINNPIKMYLTLNRVAGEVMSGEKFERELKERASEYLSEWKQPFKQGADWAYNYRQKEVDELKEKLKVQDSEYDKTCIFFEQFGDLSNCYDAEDVVRLGQRVLNEKLEQKDEVIKVLTKTLKTLQVEECDRYCMKHEVLPTSHTCNCTGMRYALTKAKEPEE